jgi:H+/Cl- antiporter ClcA
MSTPKMGNMKSSTGEYEMRSRGNLPESGVPFLRRTGRKDLESTSRFRPPHKCAHDSQRYEEDQSLVWRHHQAQKHIQDEKNWWTSDRRDDLQRWWLTFLTGCYVAATALFVGFATSLLTNFKFAVFHWLIEKEKKGAMPFGSGFVFIFLVNLSFGLVAFWFVSVESHAAGSGIPEIKCFLNGLDIPGIVSFRTLITKVLGIIFSCSAGLPLGKEGPMVHAGAIIAAGVHQGMPFLGLGTSERRDNVSRYRSTQDIDSPPITCDRAEMPNSNQEMSGSRSTSTSPRSPRRSISGGRGTNPRTSHDLKGDLRLQNDKERRDFVSCGAAAGVAAAFGAPIGGVLFSLEEGASFWSTKLTWRCFFCTMTCIFFMFFFISTGDRFGKTSNTGMFSFGAFFSLHAEVANYAVWEMFIFSLVGVMGGLIGAVFVANNGRLLLSRLARPKGPSLPRQQLVEVVMITCAMSALCILVPLLWSTCTPLPVDMENWTEQELMLVDELVPLYCDTNTQYNQAASLYLTDSDTAIKQLFHFREVGDHQDNTFNSSVLLAFFASYISMACWCAGSAVPAGMFVPSLLSGAAFGRLVGHLFHRLDRTRGHFADSGTYALMGAAAVTAGICRMTISITIMILEATGDMQYVLPLMLTVMSAQVVGNVFTEGLYDVHIHCKGLLFLEEDNEHVKELDTLVAEDVMTPAPVSLPAIVQVAEVLSVLEQTPHCCFPVVDIFPAAPKSTNEGNREKGSSSYYSPSKIENERGDSNMTSTKNYDNRRKGSNDDGIVDDNFSNESTDTGENDKKFENKSPRPQVEDEAPFLPTEPILLGAVQRQVLLTLLRAHIFGPLVRSGVRRRRRGTRRHSSQGADAAVTHNVGVDVPLLSWREVAGSEQAEHSAGIQSSTAALAALSSSLTSTQRALWVDLQPYVDIGVFSVYNTTSMPRCYRMFRTLGLRHLFVTDEFNHVRGIITRADFVKAYEDEDWSSVPPDQDTQQSTAMNTFSMLVANSGNGFSPLPREDGMGMGVDVRPAVSNPMRVESED